jgi:hypothetical protein
MKAMRTRHRVVEGAAIGLGAVLLTSIESSSLGLYVLVVAVVGIAVVVIVARRTR